MTAAEELIPTLRIPETARPMKAQRFTSKTWLLSLVIVLASLGLSACVSPPTEQELKSARYGRYPSGYQSAVNQLMTNRHAQLGDPFHVVGMSKPAKDWMGDTGERTWGYSVTVVYQAPNPTVGAPVYNYREKIFFRNGRQVAVINATNLGDVFVSALTNNLNSAAQQLSDGGGGDGDGEDSSAAPARKKRKKR